VNEKLKLKRINLALPENIVNEIDKYIEENFLTRTKWFLEAATMKLTKDQERKIDRIVKGH
jgi:metal-responsive CopG/Arc/MetJ family transcriptional regulator